MKLPTLYCRDVKDKIREWTISVQEYPTYSVIIRVHGLQEMKQQMERRLINKGKNIGKANETSHYQQACNEAQSMWRKQIDKGYSENPTPNIPLGPMLANKWDGKKNVTPCWVQPKLDGVRLLAGKQDGHIILMSRMGKIIHSLPQISKSIEHLKEGEWLDGEVYSTEIPFEEISGVFRRHTEDPDISPKLLYHVFDMFKVDNMKAPFRERFEQWLEPLFENKKVDGPLRLVSTSGAESTDHLHRYHDLYVTQGYEGLIIRDPTSPYCLKKRSRGLLKFKIMETDEFDIVGAEEARGRDKGTVVWICETTRKQTFNVRPKGTVLQRKEWWNNYTKYIGLPLTVQFQGYSEQGLPRFPVGLAIRDYEQ